MSFKTFLKRKKARQIRSHGSMSEAFQTGFGVDSNAVEIYTRKDSLRIRQNHKWFLSIQNPLPSKLRSKSPILKFFLSFKLYLSHNPSKLGMGVKLWYGSVPFLFSPFKGGRSQKTNKGKRSLSVRLEWISMSFTHIEFHLTSKEQQETHSLSYATLP